ncbi:hypothetical protein LguiA_033843 [Lonicera macranthoides]
MVNYLQTLKSSEESLREHVGMTKKKAMTASERQKKSKKHCAVAAAKKHEKTEKTVTLATPEIENDPPLKIENDPPIRNHKTSAKKQREHICD